ncbi:MAG: lactonase family protein [Lachnospiraceae bacterium]
MGKEKYVAYVGTYTHGDSKGIYIYDVDVEAGTLTQRSEVDVSNASYLAKSKSGKYLYSIEDEGVAVFSIAPNGDLTHINSVDIDGMRGCYLSTDREGKFLYVGGYHDGKVTVVHTHQDGRLGSVVADIFHKGLGSVAERNFRPHVSCVIPTPEGKYLCAVDNGIDQVKVYSMDPRTNKLMLADILRCERESGPRTMCFSKDGKFAYLLMELSNEIHVYSYQPDAKKVNFELCQEISTLSDQLDEMHDAASALEISPDGTHLFCSTAGDNSVALYEINKETGLLTKKFALPISGEYPKDIAIFPDGKHIAVANHESNSITTFTVNYADNTLVMKGRPSKVETPNCILISKTEE